MTKQLPPSKRRSKTAGKGSSSPATLPPTIGSIVAEFMPQIGIPQIPQKLLTRRPERSRWEWAKVDRIDPGLRELLRRMAGGEERCPLLLHGPAGTGKTSAAKCLLDWVDFSIFMTLDDAMKMVLSDGRWEWERVRYAPLVVLDEIGTRSKMGDLEYQGVKRVADVRDGRPTIYISNLDPMQLRLHFDDRVFSRIACGTVFLLDGPDRRMP